MTTLSLPQAPHARWLAAARKRRSRRTFDGRPLPAETLAALVDAAERWRPSDEVRIVVLPIAPVGIFRGIVGGYGRITGAPSAFVVLGASKAASVQVAAGYLGEAVVLEATALGVGTCWVGGMFNASAVRRCVEMRPDEKILAISPLGMAVENMPSSERLIYGAIRFKSRRPISEIALGLESGGWPTWARAGVEAARIAPSAHNRQPWLFRADRGGVVISFVGPDARIVSKRLDCGIAMLHFEMAVRAARASGGWEMLDHRNDVARFTLGPA